MSLFDGVVEIVVRIDKLDDISEIWWRNSLNFLGLETMRLMYVSRRWIRDCK